MTGQVREYEHGRYIRQIHSLLTSPMAAALLA